jgi:hypothetical protein
MAKKRNWLGVAVLLVLLVVFPVMSYIYMKAGFDYQIEARDELQELGAVPTFPGQTIFGDSLTGKDLGKQIQLLAYFDPAREEVTQINGKYLSEIYGQFDEVDWFRMELMVPESSKAALQRFLTEKNIEDPEQVFFYGTDRSREQFNEQLHIGQDMRSAPNVVALADTAGVVRQYYDLTDGKQFVRLVEHIAMMRPQEKDERQEALFRREREL